MPRTGFLVALVAAIGLLGRRVAGDDGTAARPRDASSAFYIARSTNKNQVHYGVRVDGACNVVGDKPVYGYWRMLEKRGEIEPILGIEQPAYGVDESQRVQRSAAATVVHVRLRAFPERPIVVTLARGESGCEAVATMPIGGADARLQSIYVKVKWPFGIDYVLVRGVAKDGRHVEETIQN
jgi:Domain of unknown function (DUF4833)